MKYDAGLRDQLTSLLRQDRRPEVQDVLAEILSIVDELLRLKALLKSVANKVDQVRRKARSRR